MIKLTQQKEPIDNSALIAAIKEMKANSNDETQSKVINIALHSTFLVPAIVDNNTRIVADENNQVHFDDTPQAKFLLIEHPKLGPHIPVFTDKDEISKLKADKPFNPVAMKFPYIAQLVTDMPNAKGFVINPLSDPLPFSQKLLDHILQQIIKKQEELKQAKAAQGNIEQ